MHSAKNISDCASSSEDNNMDLYIIRTLLEYIFNVQ
jgi:hypothetical protein